MAAKNWVVLLGVGLLASCIIPGGEVPGLFYKVQLPDSRPDSVCLEFAGDLVASAPLRVVDQMLPTRPRGACIVELDNEERSPRELVTIDWDPGSRTLGIHVKQAGTSKTTTSTQEVASQVLAAVHKKFPDGVITTVKPHYGFLGP
jgi:hypothetical protein